MPSQQAFCMNKTHNFLQALEIKSGSNSGRAAIDINLPPPSPDRSSSGGGAAPVERGLPDGVTHVKAEWPTSAVEFSHWTSDGSGGGVAGRAAVVSKIRSNSKSGGGLTLWEGHQATKEQKQQQQHLRCPSPYASPSSNCSFSSLNSTRNQFTVVQENNRHFVDATSKSSKVLTDDDHEEVEFGKRNGSSLKVRVDGRSCNGQKATTPRSKHSATEQRRRSRINDRLQILRDLIPQSDQKRDKASFLSEVIKYIQFLHEKVQKYESEYPGWNQEKANILPWVKVLFRSFWEHTQKNSQIHAQDVINPSHFLKNIPAPPGFIISASDTVLPTPVMLENNQTQVESENLRPRLASKVPTVSVPLQPYSIGSDFVQNEPSMISDLKNMVNHSQSLCLRTDSATGGDMLRKQELSIDEGMISISSAYSQGLMDSFTSALLNSGVDMSQARIDVQINLGKPVFKGTQSNPKNQEDPLYRNHANGKWRVGSSGGVGSEQGNKRQKTGKS